jgi:hypothetical protein
MFADRPPIAPRQPADQRIHVLGRLQPRLCPDETPNVLQAVTFMVIMTAVGPALTYYRS